MQVTLTPRNASGDAPGSPPSPDSAGSTGPGALATRPTRVALVGTGYVADTHLEALREVADVLVVVLCDPLVERARAAARKHGIPAVVGSIAELEAHAPDAVHLCVPPDLHASLARECLQRGMAVFVEKPLALSAAEARDLGALAQGLGHALGANHNAIFHPAFRRLQARLQAGEIGRLEHVDVQLAVPLRQLEARDYSHWMFRAPENIVFEQAVHPFSQLARLIGRPLELRPSVLSTRELAPGQPFHERWAIAARGERGTATLHFAFGATFARSVLSVLGSDGVLEADLLRDALSGERKSPWLDFWDAYLASTRRAAQLRADARRNLLAYCKQTLRLAPRRDPYFAGMRASMRAFHAALRAGAPAPVPAEEAAVVLEWCQACVRELSPAPRAALPAPAAARTPAAPVPPARAREVVVLGASGFIGRATLEALARQGLPTTAVVRRTHGLAPRITERAGRGELRLLRAELTDPEALARAVRGAHTVLHLATGNGSTWEEIERVMVGGTRAVAEACLAERVQRLVYVSSIAALYLGPDCGSPRVEDSTATDPRPAQRAPYARGKIAAEQELGRLARERGLAVTLVRPGVVLGPEAPLQHSGIGLWVRDNHCVGWGRGERPLPLVLVDDVADALARLAAFEGHALDGAALNLAARVPLSARRTVEELARLTGRDFHFHGRSLALSQSMEIGKWLVKKAGGRRDPFPSLRDLKSRSLWPELTCRTAREQLGWRPCEEPEEFLRRWLADGASLAPPSSA